MFTIAIPYYSHETYLKQAVESVIKQIYTEWHLIISLDNPLSKEFLNYLKTVPTNKLTIVENSEHGICGNWNNCVSACTTDYLTILHSDDVLELNYLEEMHKLVKKHPEAELYFCDVNIIDKNSKPKFSFQDFIKNFLKNKDEEYILKGDTGLASLLKGCFIFCPSICYRKNVVSKLMFDERWAMVLDLHFYFKFLLKGYEMVGLNKRLFNYRRHNANQTAKLTENFSRFDEEISLYKYIFDKLPDSWHMSKDVAQNKRIIKYHLLYLLCISLIKLNFGRFKLLALFYKKHFLNSKLEKK